MGTTGFIDTEFNGFGGELISMAIVTSNGAEFYEVKQIPSDINPWVKDNVIPVLHKQAVGPEEFTQKLHLFLCWNMPQIIVADWPSDLEHFFREMLGADHSESLPFHVTAKLDPSIKYSSEVPHNALHDARAIMRAYTANPKG